MNPPLHEPTSTASTLNDVSTFPAMSAADSDDSRIRLESNDASVVGPRCCGWTAVAGRVAPAAMVLGLVVVGMGIVAAAFMMGRNSAADMRSGSAADLPAEFALVDAAAAVSSEKFSLATGPVSDDGEGLFMLDHNTGVLQCQVIYPRIGRVGASFQTNVAEALGTGGKGGSYLMLTGRVNFPRSSNSPAASVAVYVMDTATGNFVCYGVPFNTSMVNAGRPQGGAMVLITSGSANTLIDRDQLR